MEEKLHLVKEGIMDANEKDFSIENCERIMLEIEKKYGNGEDEEEFHHCGDELMELILIKYGYEQIVNIFERNAKWYC